MPRPLLIDLETRSACDLKVSGGYNYAAHESTRLLTAAWTEDGRTVHLWTPGCASPPADAEPDTVWHTGPENPLAALTDRVWVAHNAWTFDRPVWAALYPECQPRRWWDSYPLALAAGLPGGLEQIAQRLWGEGKLKEGRSALLKHTRAVSVADADPRNVPPGLTWLIGRYNAQDIRLLAALWDELSASLHLTAHEREVQAAHDECNDRGVRVDLGLVRALRDLSIAGVEHAVREIARITDGRFPDLASLRKRTDLIAWMKRQGVVIQDAAGKDTLRREIVLQWLDANEPDEDAEDVSLAGDDRFATAAEDSVPPEGFALVRRVLTLRNAAMRITGGKLDAALGVTDANGRARGLFVLNGAHTGRWAGRRIQVQNLTKPKPGVDMWLMMRLYAAKGCFPWDDVVKVIAAGVRKENKRRAKSGQKPLAGDELPTHDDACAACMRGIFLPNEGDECLLAADLSSIEARVLAELAGEQKLLAAFRSGSCPYSVMAEALYGRPVRDKKDPIRQVGKVIVLGCLAKGTPVLTDHGWKPIESVLATDRVWDGEAWVTHGGVVAKGTKEVLECAGVWMTPEHEVLTEGGRLPSGRYSSNGRFSLSPSARAAESWLPCADARAGRPAPRSPRTCDATVPPGATRAPGGRGTRRGPSTPTCAPSRTAAVYSVASAPSSSDAAMLTILTTEAGAYGCGPHGSRIDGRSCLTCGRFRERTTGGWNSTAPTTSGGTNRGTSVSWTARPTTGTPDEVGGWFTRDGRTTPPSSSDCSCLSTGTWGSSTVTLTPGEPLPSSSGASTLAETYDIVDAGPRHRFQAGPLIVHNCGYGLGDEKFGTYGEVMGIDFAVAGVTPYQCVQKYRDTFPRIAGVVCGEIEGRPWRRGGFWADLDAAALSATRDPGHEYAVGRLRFLHARGHLYVTLPSGRELCYRQARVVQQRTKWGKDTDCVEYQSPRFRATRQYGGKWAENVVQATSRDFLAAALVARRGSAVLHVHDELVCSGNRADLPGFMADFTAPLSWAAGLPLDAEGGIMPRYAKTPPSDWPKEETWRDGRKT